MPRITALDWDEGNVDHLWHRHHVAPDEVHEILFGCDREEPDYRILRNGDAYKIFGETGSGRLLKMLGRFTVNGRFRIFHAMDMDRDEKRAFRAGK